MTSTLVEVFEGKVRSAGRVLTNPGKEGFQPEKGIAASARSVWLFGRARFADALFRCHNSITIGIQIGEIFQLRRDAGGTEFSRC